jgi:hypothetical protein
MKLRQPARKQPTLRGSCRRPRSIGGGSWRKLSPMPQCKLFGETPAGLLDPIDLQHPALARIWTRPIRRCKPRLRAVFCLSPRRKPAHVRSACGLSCAGWPLRPLTVLEAMIYSPGRRIRCRLMRGDISAGQRGVRIDLEGDGGERQYKNDDESSHGPVVAAECGGIGRRSRRKPELLFGNAVCSGSVFKCSFLS